MKALSALLLAAFATTSYAQVDFKSQPGQIEIRIDGKPFSTFFIGNDAPKPYLHPLRAASGAIVTRMYPMSEVAGETNDHPHHRGLFFGHIDVNGTDTWSNEAVSKGANKGKVVLKKVVAVKPGKASGSIRATFDWLDVKSEKILTEDRTMTFYSKPDLRMFDFDVTLTAAAKPVVFGDDKDGTLAIRLADDLTEKKTGKMTNAEGAQTMANVWGKPSNWVDYVGQIDGKTIGVAMFDAPSNPGHPNRWHARDYGLFAVNFFGQQTFDKNLPKKETTIQPGKSLHYVFRVVIHNGTTEEAKVSDLYTEFAGR